MKTTLIEDFKNLWMAIKGLESELRAYELAFTVLKETLAQQGYADFPQLADAAIVGARRSPFVLERMRKQYDVVLEEFLQGHPEPLSQEEVLKLLAMPLITKKIQ